MNRHLKLLIFYTGLVVVWALVARLQFWPPYLFPSPSSVAKSLANGFADRTFVIGLVTSLRRVAIGYGLSVVLGVALGFFIAVSRTMEETLGSLVTSLQSLPSICWLPLAVLWFGLSEKAIIFVVVAGSLLAITISTVSGIHNVPRNYIMAGRNLGASGWRMFAHVLLPASLPQLLAGFKQGWAFAWRSLISGEMIFVTLGLGQLLMMGRDLNDMSQVVAVMLIIIVIGFTVDRVVFAALERGIRRKWGLGALT